MSYIYHLQKLFQKRKSHANVGMTSASMAVAMPSMRPSSGSTRGRAKVRVGRARVRGAKGGRRRSFWATGAWPAAEFSGGRRWSAEPARTRAEGREQSGAGGSPAHQERDEQAGLVGGGRTTTESSAAVAAGGGGDDPIRPIGGIPARVRRLGAR